MRTFLLSTIHPDHYRVQSQQVNFKFDREYVRVMDKRLKIHGILEENNLSAGETVYQATCSMMWRQQKQEGFFPVQF